jgi:hypothetical protein
MKHNKNFHFAFIAVALLTSEIHMATAQFDSHVVKWVVEKNSTLRVAGKSNVNSFTCKINVQAEKDTITCVNNPSKSISLSGDIQIDVISFDCQSNLITRDLRKTLKADQYPKMIIRFLTLEGMPVLQNKTELIKGWVEVELAGVVKKFELCYSFSRATSGYIQLDGGKSFSFSDFKLSPPRKLAGLIRIKDAFDVNFQLILRSL